MSVGYRAVQWTPYKRRYDLALLACVGTYLITFIAAGKLVWRGRESISDEILVLRAFGTCAFILLHVVLAIGPLARLDPRFLPLLYNRRHLGVMTFLLGLAHAILAIGFYHGFGVVNPFVSLLTSNTQYGSLRGFPFETLGLVALTTLFVMAATSHDFWLKNLTPGVWKAIHMLVYVAWAALVMHVALGALQSERSPVYAVLLLGGAALVASLHVIAGAREQKKDAVGAAQPGGASWRDIGSIDDIADGRGKVVCLPGAERVAVFRQGETVSAVGNVCAHQGGPLGEGKIIDGCITCPWHGFQYRPHDGCAPPPFAEKIPTYELRIAGRRILLNPVPLPPGTPVEPARASSEEHEHEPLCTAAGR